MIFSYCCGPQAPIRPALVETEQDCSGDRLSRRAPSPKVTNHQVVMHGRGLSLAKSIEVIELICYSISPSCMLVEADKRCSLIIQENVHESTNRTTTTTYARPLQDLEEGRKYLDSELKPESIGLLRLNLDKKNNQLEFRPMNENDTEFVDNRTGSSRLAERLSMSSFVLVERDNQASKTAGQGNDNDKLELFDSNDARKSNADLLSSLSIELIQDDEVHMCELENELHEKQQQQKQHQIEVPRRVKRSKRFNWRKLFGGVRDNSTGAEDTPYRASDADPDSRIDDSNRSYTYDGHQLINHLNLESSRDPTGRQQQHGATLERPDSIYLWPEPLTRVYDHIDQNSPVSNIQPVVSSLSGTPPPLVMISYNHKEAKSFAIELHAELDRLGVRAYLDLYDIKNGQDWQDSLNFAILDCRLFVPLITPSYGETLWTSREFKLADVLNKRIVPINFTRRWPPPSLAIQIATVQYFDWLYRHQASGCTLTPDADNWPPECVQAIAIQIRRILMQREAFIWPGNSQMNSAPSASGHSSGYESRMSPELTTASTLAMKWRDSAALTHSRVPVLREPRESDPMLAFERVGRARNRNQLVRPAPSERTQAARKWSQHSHQSPGSSPSTASYGSLGGEGLLTSASSSGAPSYGQNVGAAIPTPKSKPFRKKSLGHRTKNVFSKFKRSISGGDGASRERDLLA